MATPLVVTALGRKRAALAGEIKAHERAIKSLRTKIEVLDAALALFGYRGSPANVFKTTKPYRPPMFRTGQLKRLVMDIRREAGRPLTNQDIAAEVTRSLGWEATPDLLRAMANKVKDVTKRLPKPPDAD
jgi:hypothetical protein